MCGRYQVDTNKDALEKRYGIEFSASFKSNYNVSPSQHMPVVKEDTIELKQWGLPLKFGDKVFKKLINVRADSLQKPWAKRYIRSQRCLIPSTGFYEWQRNGTSKTPYYIGQPDHDIFSFAGIYDEDTYAIITTDANKEMQQVHDRMPVILTKEEEKDWINPDLIENEHIMKLVHPYKSKLEMYPISSAVNNPRNNDASIFMKLAV